MTSDDQNECPLCMEPFEVDDMSFYPCTCGYQICRFCWHRLKIDGNGLCPACRKAYSENPAHFEPLSEDEIVRIKKERRHKEVQKKQKLSENRRHLADVRVVQKNLVFIVGLSHRLADADILRKNEYFGKFGKITKVVINASPSYAGAQTPSASAYVTYSKPDEALKAIQTVNNVQIDNRVLKASLGTTKYCSHFLKGVQCPKGDCMYLHDLGEDNASFTKEQMSQGKHLEYESKLIENILHIPKNLQNISNDQSNQIIVNQIHQGLPSALLNHPSNQTSSTNQNSTTNQTNNSASATSNNSNSTTSNELKPRSKTKSASSSHQNRHNPKVSSSTVQAEALSAANNGTVGGKTYENSNEAVKPNEEEYIEEERAEETDETVESTTTQTHNIISDSNSPVEINLINPQPDQTQLNEGENKVENETTLQSDLQQTEMMLNNLNKLTLNDEAKECIDEPIYNPNALNNLLTASNFLVPEEDLGFDPWGESTKALQDLMKIESKICSNGKPLLGTASQNLDLNTVPNAQAVNLPKTSTYSPNNYNLTTNNNNNTHNNANTRQQYINSNQPSFYSKLNSVTGHDLNQMYPNQYQNVSNMNGLLNEENKINEILLGSLNGLTNNGANFKDNLLLQQLQNQNHLMHAQMPAQLMQQPHASSFISQDFSNSNGPFNQENYLSKLLLQKQQNISSKQSIVPPPGFNSTTATSNPANNGQHNNVVFNSPISTSSTSSSSSSTSSSVNNSTSTTPALNQNTSNKAASCLINEFSNENVQESMSNKPSQLNSAIFSKNLQDTFRSIFPNAHISFGSMNPSNNTKLTNSINNTTTNSKSPFGLLDNKNSNKQSCWPDDPAIVSLNNGISKDLNEHLGELKERDFDSIYNHSNNNNMNNMNNMNINNTNPIDLLPGLSSLNHQQPNNLNNLTHLLKKQQIDQQLNNSLLNQFQYFYQQQQHLAQFNNSFQNQNSINKLTNDNQHLINKNLDELQNHHKLMLLNNNFNTMNSNNNFININNYLNNANELNGYSNPLNAVTMNNLNGINSNIGINSNNINGYGYVIDSNQNIQSANLSGVIKQLNNSVTPVTNPMLSMQQQQGFMQQFISNFTNTASANSNSE